MSGNLVLLRAELDRLSRRYREGIEKNSELRKVQRKMEKLRFRIAKLVN